MERPQFLEPLAPEDVRVGETGSDVPSAITLALGDTDDDRLLITGFDRDLPRPGSAEDRGRLAKVGDSNELASLSEDSWYAVGRAVVHPETVAVQLRYFPKAQHGMLTDEHVEGATLRSVHTRTWLTELFPGLQPRTGQEALPVPDPAVRGELDESGRPRATVEYWYDSREHLRRHLRQTLVHTRRANPHPYDQSILSRRITRAVIAHPVNLCFRDSSEPLFVLAVRDGITRITSAWAVLTGSDDPEAIADSAVKVLLARSKSRRGPDQRQMAQGRQEQLAELHEEFLRGTVDGQTSERAVRIGQTLVVPAQITVGLQSHSSVLPAHEVFDDAVRSILASVHVEFKAWEPAAQNVEVGTRALKRVMLTGAADRPGDELRLLHDLAVGLRGPEDTPLVFRDDRIPGTALWRAVYLIHALTRGEVHLRMKQYAKEIKGISRMGIPGFADLLGPVVDLPWRATKSSVLRQARNAWSNGGVVFDELRDTSWEPAPCKDFTELVPAARAGAPDARFTLAVAGGVALIADKVLTRDVGSADRVTVPFRAAVNQTVANLSAPGNEQGLWLLALAANAFRPDGLAGNSLTGKQFMHQAGQMPAYTLPDTDSNATDRIARDSTGTVVPLTSWRAVSIADPRRAAEAQELAAAARKDELPPEERLAALRSRLRGELDQAWQTLGDLVELASSPELHSSVSPFGSRPEWQKLAEPATKLQATLVVNQPADSADIAAEEDRLNW